MFNLFQSQKQIVTKIHNEFDSAQEKLLAEAKQIIGSTNASKADRLLKVGFSNAQGVKEFTLSRENAQLIEHYKMNYPFQKFLTESELNRICKKYNLAYAPISHYIKDVPTKNLEEIERAKPLEKSLLPTNGEKTKLRLETWLIPTGSDFLSIWSKWRWILPKEMDGHWDVFSADWELNKKYNTGIRYLVSSVKQITIDKQGLFIAAPKSHFNMSGLSKTGQYGFSKISIVEPKDPIVFRYCKGGIQVITKWGLEASDELAVNERMN